jgi:signal transduction histidine kinase
MRLRLLVLFYFFGIGIEWAAAQDSDGDLSLADRHNYDIRQYNSESGLPQNSATGLLLDTHNFLWVTTQNGLVRFDGRRFRIYDKSNTPAIRSNRFSVIAESSKGEVLLGSSYDPAEVYKVEPDYAVVIDTLRSRITHKFLHLNAAGFFDCTSLFGYYARARDGVDTVLLNRLSSSEAFVILNDTEVVVRDGPNAWYYMNNVSMAVNRLPIGFKEESAHFFVLGGIFCIFDESREWRFFQHGKETGLRVDATVPALMDEARPWLKPMLGPGADQVLVRAGKDIYELYFQNDVLKARLIFPDLKVLDQLIATSLLFDKKNQRLFIATVTSGFIVVTKKIFRTATFASTDRLNNAFKAIQLLPNGRILTQNGLLDKSEGGGGLFKEDQRPDGNCLYKARDGSIWLSREKRLRIYDSNFSKELSVDTLPLDSYIGCIIEDSRRTVWVSTLTSLLKIKDGRLQYVIRRYPLFATHNIESIAEVSPMVLWIATRDGIYVYDIARNSIAGKPVLPHVYARNIYRAKDSSIWVATYGNGFYKYEGGIFTALPIDPENYLSAAHAFLEDDNGYFWIDTNHGLFRTRKKDLDEFVVNRGYTPYYYYFDKSSGFNTNEFNGGCNPASQRDPEGNFYFPSLDGVVYFNPGRVDPEVPDGEIFVDDLFVDSVRTDPGKAFVIKPDFHEIVVDITTPFYGLEENLKLEYTLDAIGRKWYPVNRDGRITIHRLPYGKYTLAVRKNNGGARDRYTHMRIVFEVQPHWYQGWLFYVLLVLAAGSLVFFLYRLRTRILLQQNRRLQKKVEERTSELEQSTILKERLLSVIMHDMRSPLFSQALMIDHLQRNYRKFSEKELNELFFVLKDSSDRICQFSTDFLLWYNSQRQGFSLRYENIRLPDFIEETTLLYRNIALRKGLYFDLHIPSGLGFVSDKNILAIVIRNLVDNAVKYTGAGGVGISASRENGHIQIQVKDTGQGMSARKIAEITSSDEKGPGGTTSNFGYRFIMELTRKLEGVVNIYSAPAGGTTVVVRFRA